jgi:DnaJ-class molecular chaperone
MRSTKRKGGHGPYWYAFWKEGGKTRSKYVGKARPGRERRKEQRDERHAPPPPRAPMENDWTVIGVRRGAPWDDIKRAYRAATKRHHPDVGGDPRRMVRLNQAFARLRHQHGR